MSLSQSQGNREKEDPFDIDIEELRSAPNDDVDGENSRIDESEKSCGKFFFLQTIGSIIVSVEI